MLVEVDDVSKSFGKKSILKGVNFYADKNEIVGLVGPSGAGKSVLIKLLIGFLSPDSGAVRLSPGAVLGFSMQNNSLYDYLTVKQNLFYFARIFLVPSSVRKQVIKDLIQRLDLESYEDVLVKNLSGGTRKRVDIACALVNNPEILVLDEPFLGLDPSLVRKLSSFISELNKEGKTVIVSSHRLDELSKLCSRFVLVKDGGTWVVDKARVGEVYS